MQIPGGYRGSRLSGTAVSSSRPTGSSPPRDILIQSYLCIPQDRLPLGNALWKDIYGGEYMFRNPSATRHWEISFDPSDPLLTILINPLLKEYRYDLASTFNEKIDIAYRVFFKVHIQPHFIEYREHPTLCPEGALFIGTVLAQEGFVVTKMDSPAEHYFIKAVSPEGKTWIIDFTISQYVCRDEYGIKYMDSYLELIGLNPFVKNKIRNLSAPSEVGTSHKIIL